MELKSSEKNSENTKRTENDSPSSDKKTVDATKKTEGMQFFCLYIKKANNNIYSIFVIIRLE